MYIVRIEISNVCRIGNFYYGAYKTIVERLNNSRAYPIANEFLVVLNLFFKYFKVAF